MARYTGPSYRRARRLGFSISETGKELAKRAYAPGQHGQKRAKKQSNYGVHAAMSWIYLGVVALFLVVVLGILSKVVFYYDDKK